MMVWEVACGPGARHAGQYGMQTYLVLGQEVTLVLSKKQIWSRVKTRHASEHQTYIKTQDMQQNPWTCSKTPDVHQKPWT